MGWSYCNTRTEWYTVSTQNPNVIELCPSNCESIGTINLGLIGQLHYVGLDKINEQSVDDDSNELIDNENIHEGDRQITGSPLESCMSFENPESNNQIYSIAPAEGEKPISFMTDKDFETMCNPSNFPLCNGTFSALK